MKAILVRNGKHQRPIKAVFDRYGLGTPDKYDRGIWVTPDEIKKTVSMMDGDKSLIRKGEGKFVRGTNMHNYVSDLDLLDLIEQEK